MPTDSFVSIQAGDTFIMGRGGHLWIVISDPAKHLGAFVMVNLTTNADRAGTECELNKGDHRGITQKCYVNFADAKEVNPKQAVMIGQYIKGKTIDKHFPLEPLVLQKIIAAAKKSKAIAVVLKKYL